MAHFSGRWPMEDQCMRPHLPPLFLISHLFFNQLDASVRIDIVVTKINVLNCLTSQLQEWLFCLHTIDMDKSKSLRSTRERTEFLTRSMISPHLRTYYRIAGNFGEVLIFAIFARYLKTRKWKLAKNRLHISAYYRIFNSLKLMTAKI